ncbi:MAG: cation:proton antiporter [Proteobacteria bacterium]|nr:cation:proton antiporter [Pseudomonadota bacterium]NBY20268.1 cation:proton antiporter [bacterium]
MPLLTTILILLIVARLLGQLMVHLKQPALVGEIFAGILLGPAVLQWIRPNQALEGISELSVFLIVVAAGFEMEMGEVVKAIKGKGFVAAMLGFLIPLAGGIALGSAIGFDAIRTFFLGLCMSITALPVTIQILSSFNLLQSRIASFSIATSILNDILGLLCLGIILDRQEISTSSGLVSLIISVLKTSLKLALFAFLVFITNRLIQWGTHKTKYIERTIQKLEDVFGPEAIFGTAIIFVLFFGSMSESLGSHFIIGAFFGALLLSHDVFGTSVFSGLQNTVTSLTSGFLGPVFFAYIGLSFSIHAFSNPLLIFGVLSVSILTKLIAGYLGGRLLKMSHLEALGSGIILNGRGIMELVVANIAYQKKLIDQDLFSTLIIMGIVTTVVTPILFSKTNLGSTERARV